MDIYEKCAKRRHSSFIQRADFFGSGWRTGEPCLTPVNRCWTFSKCRIYSVRDLSGSVDVAPVCTDARVDPDNDLLWSLKDGLLGGINGVTVSRNVADSKFGCCDLKISDLGPDAGPWTEPESDTLRIAFCHFLVKNFILEMAMTTHTATLKRPYPRRGMDR